MELENDKKHWNVSHLLLLLLITAVCFWPLTFEIFSAKNDNITQFLPVRFHVSEALRYGHLPLWSPYMYLGYPIHGDMQGGAWNPIVWLLSSFGRYNVTSLHAEILVYVFLAGLGMYRLLSALNLSPTTCFVGGTAYLMSGYVTDVSGSNLPFLAAAAYIPFVFAYYYHLLTTPSLTYALKTAILFTLLLVSAYPSFFICTGYILLAALAVTTFRNLKNKKKIFFSQGVMLITFLALSAPAIFSYWEILPHYTRGSGVTLASAFENSFHPSCNLSFILPGVPIKNPQSFSTDLISRNGYFNILILIFLLSYPFSKRTFFQNFTVAGIAFFFLFALGNRTPVRGWCYKLLPLMDTFRHPSNARLFLIIGCIVVGLGLYNKVFNNKNLKNRIIQITFFGMLLMLLLVILSFPKTTVFSYINLPISSHDWRKSLKLFLDNITFYDMLLLNSLLQAVFLSILFFFLKKINSERHIALLILINSFVFAQITIPYTTVSKISPAVANGILREYPKGFPKLDQTKNIAANSEDALKHFEIVGIETFYNKTIGTTDLVLTPTFMSLMSKTYQDTTIKNHVLSHPYAYFQNDSDSFYLDKFWNNSFTFITKTHKPSIFILQQLNLPGWRCFINEKKVNILSYNLAFMSVNVPAGENKITFVYQPKGMLITISIFIIAFFTILGFGLKKIFSVRKP